MQQNQQRALELMTRGPHLLNDMFIIVPSNWYSPTAAQCWKANGFAWNGGCRMWTRNTSLPAKDGKTYTASAWLRWTRRKFYKNFWPELQRTCRYCQQKFVPHNIYDIICTECRKGEYDD